MDRTQLARSVAAAMVQTADMNAAIRIAQKIVAEGHNNATICVATVLVLSETLDLPEAPVGAIEAWFEAMQMLLQIKRRGNA